MAHENLFQLMRHVDMPFDITRGTILMTHRARGRSQCLNKYTLNMDRRVLPFLSVWLMFITFHVNQSVADERPRNATFVLNTNGTQNYANGHSISSSWFIRIYFSVDGTAYVNTNGEKIEGVIVPPTLTSGSYSFVDSGQNIKNTLSIRGDVSSLDIDLLIDACPRLNICAHYRMLYNLQISGGNCRVRSGSFAAVSDANAPNPIIGSFMSGQTCEIRTGRDLTYCPPNVGKCT